MKKITIYKTIFVILISLLFTGCNSQPAIKEKDYESTSQEIKRASKVVRVKYRNTSVDRASGDFEYLPTSSSFVNGAWYDQSNKYMIIKLMDTYYHYCGLPTTTWSSFKKASSFGTYYNSYIKGNYDCRQGYVPNY